MPFLEHVPKSWSHSLFGTLLQLLERTQGDGGLALIQGQGQAMGAPGSCVQGGGWGSRKGVRASERRLENNKAGLKLGISSGFRIAQGLHFLRLSPLGQNLHTTVFAKYSQE